MSWCIHKPWRKRTCTWTPQRDSFSKIHVGFNASKEYVFQIKRTYYGQKRGAWVWNQHLVRKLQEAGFTQSSHEECVFYHGTAMYVLYMDDSIQAGPNQNELGDIIAKMEQTGLNMTYDNGIEDFFGCPC